MTTEIQSVKVLARDKVNEKEKELTEMMIKHTKILEKHVDENITEMVTERRFMLERNEK